MKRKAIVFLICICMLLAAMLACVDGGGSGGDGGWGVTATFGADQWHLQETAIWTRP